MTDVDSGFAVLIGLILTITLFVILFKIYFSLNTVKKIVTDENGNDVVVEFKKVNGKYVKVENGTSSFKLNKLTPVNKHHTITLMRREKHLVVIRNDLEDIFFCGPFWFLKYNLNKLAISGAKMFSAMIFTCFTAVFLFNFNSLIFWITILVILNFAHGVYLLKESKKTKISIMKEYYEKMGYRVVVEGYTYSARQLVDSYIDKNGEGDVYTQRNKWWFVS